MEKPMAQSKVAARKEKVHHLPLETLQAIDGVEMLVHGCQVSLAPASEFFKKHWEIYSEIVKDHATRISPVTYLLSERLLKATGRQLLILSKDEINWLKRGYKPSDILASAMCKAAREIGPPGEEPDESSEYWLYDQPIWGAEHPISEAWSALGELSVPGDVEESLRLNADTRKWVRGPIRQGAEDPDEVYAMRAAAVTSDHPFFKNVPSGPGADYTDRFVVRISRSFEKRRTQLPKLTIEVEGVPVCQFMKAFQSNPKSADTGLKEAAELTGAVVEWIRYSIGPRRTNRGRPSKGKGADAAFLFYHAELPWSEVARKLCPTHHRHNSHCKENFRKQADQYWKRLRKRFRLPK